MNSNSALPENVNYAVKSSFLLGFLESVPEVAAQLKEPETQAQKFEDVVKSAEQAAVRVLVFRFLTTEHTEHTKWGTEEISGCFLCRPFVSSVDSVVQCFSAFNSFSTFSTLGRTTIWQ